MDGVSRGAGQAFAGLLEHLVERFSNRCVDRAADERLEPDLLVQADLPVRQQQERRLAPYVALDARSRVVLQRAAEHALAAALTQARLERLGERVERLRVRADNEPIHHL